MMTSFCHALRTFFPVVLRRYVQLIPCGASAVLTVECSILIYKGSISRRRRHIRRGYRWSCCSQRHMTRLEYLTAQVFERRKELRNTGEAEVMSIPRGIVTWHASVIFGRSV